MKTLNDFLEEKTTITYDEIESAFEEQLDELEGAVSVCGLEYSPSYVLKEVDPTAYRCAVADFSDDTYIEYEGNYYLIDDFDDAQAEFEDYESEQEDE